MKILSISAIAIGLMLAATPAAAAVMVEPVDGTTAEIFVAAADAPVAQVAVAPAEQAFGGVNDAITSYASMLPVPSEWMLMLIGFAVIGYAMRSRKRGRVSFN